MSEKLMLAGHLKIMFSPGHLLDGSLVLAFYLDSVAPRALMGSMLFDSGCGYALNVSTRPATGSGSDIRDVVEAGIALSDEDIFWGHNRQEIRSFDTSQKSLKLRISEPLSASIHFDLSGGKMKLATGYRASSLRLVGEEWQDAGGEVQVQLESKTIGIPEFIASAENAELLPKLLNWYVASANANS
jgi:hypothetical protein